MMKPNYALQKRQRDLAKKQKKEEKRLKKTGGNENQAPDVPPSRPDEGKTTG